jgi:hypothetical protein
MAGQKPHHSEYYKYLQYILGADHTDTSFFITTEKDFAKSGNIDYPYRSYLLPLGHQKGKGWLSLSFWCV